MDLDKIKKWQEADKEIESILKTLAKEYVKIKDLGHLNISFDIKVSDLYVIILDTFRNETDHVGGFSIKPMDLICPAAVINKWRLKWTSQNSPKKS